MTIVSGFDGTIEEPAEDPQSMMSELLVLAPETSSEELEDSVFITRSFTLCPVCRGAILRDPLQRGGGGPSGRLS